MPQSYKEYSSGELSTKTYNVPFKYISISDVNVIGFDGSKWTPLALDASSPTDAINKTVTLADTPAASYTKIRLYRATSTTQLVDFQNGSRLSESDLDTAYQQGLFAAQEIVEDASTSQFAAVRQAGLQSGTSLSNFDAQEFTGDGTTVVFSITEFTPQTTVAMAYRVSIDGVMQSPTKINGDYTISLSPAQITFTSAPPTGSKIIVVTAASSASAVSVDDVTIGLTSANEAEIIDGSVTNDKLAGGITQDKLAGGITNAQLAGSITQDKLAGSIATSKLAEVIDDDTFTTGVSATSLASSESIKAYADSSPKAQMKVDNVLGASVGASTESVTFANGLVMKWGIKTFTHSGGTITFDNAFPTACINIQATEGGTDQFGGIGVTFYNKTSFTCNPSSGGTFHWQAVGY